MRLIYIIIFLLPVLLYGQKTAQWETTFYFEDAAGNRDTITLGYDEDANNTYNRKSNKQTNFREHMMKTLITHTTPILVRRALRKYPGIAYLR
jgi:hypothetical protein